MGFADNAVQDGVGDGRFGDVLVPFSDRELADDDGAAAFVAVFEDLEQKELDGVGNGLKAKVVEDKQGSFSELVEPLDDGAVGPAPERFVHRSG